MADVPADGPGYSNIVMYHAVPSQACDGGFIHLALTLCRSAVAHLGREGVVWYEQRPLHLRGSLSFGSEYPGGV